MSKLQQELELHESRRASLEHELQVKTEELITNEAATRAARMDLEEYNAILRDELGSVNRRAEAASQDAQRTIAEQRRQSTSLAHERDELETELQHARQRLTQSAHEARLEQQAAADQLALAKRDLEELRESARATKGELASTKQDAAQVRQALARKEDECSGLRQELVRVQAALEATRMDLTSSLEAHDGDASRREAALRKGLGEVQQQVEQFSDRARRAEHDSASLQGKLLAVETRCIALEAQLQDTKQGAPASVLEQLFLEQRRCSELESQLQALRADQRRLYDLEYALAVANDRTLKQQPEPLAAPLAAPLSDEDTIKLDDSFEEAIKAQTEKMMQLRRLSGRLLGLVTAN